MVLFMYYVFLIFCFENNIFHVVFLALGKMSKISYLFSVNIHYSSRSCQ